MKKNIFITIIAIILLFAGMVYAQNMIEFTWNHNSETDLKGYRLYQSQTSGQYENCLPVLTIPAGTNMATLDEIEPGQYYWILTAYDTSDNESGPSNEVSMIIAPSDSEPPGSPSGFSANIIIKINIGNNN